MAPKCEIVHHTVVKKPKSIPTNATGRWGTTPVKPERQKEVDFHLPSVLATFYDTGLLRILLYDSAGRSRAIQLTNTRGLYTSGHMQKFLETLQEVADTSKVNFGNSRNMTLEYNDAPNGEAFRAIIDDPSLSPASKFAAIWSMLIVAPTLDSKHVLEIAKHQKNPVTEEGVINFWGMSDFMLPHYDPSVDHRPIAARNFLTLDNENIAPVLNLISFLKSDDESKTFREFSEESSDDYIEKAIGCSQEVTKSASEIYIGWGTAALKSFSLPLLRRITAIHSHGASANLKELLLNRILAGETMKIEIDPKASSYMASFLTESEYEDFMENCDKFSKSDRIPDEMGALALEVLVHYYLIGGFSKVRELLEFTRTVQHGILPFYYTKSVFEVRSPVNQKLKAPHFMLFLSDDYREMPLGWAIPLVVAEIEAEKQETEKKLVAAGVPIAA